MKEEVRPCEESRLGKRNDQRVSENTHCQQLKRSGRAPLQKRQAGATRTLSTTCASQEQRADEPMSIISHTMKNILWSGTYAGLCMSTAIGLTGKITTTRPVVPLNAISHIFWGHKAARSACWSIKYTASGLLLNQLACIFWAACYETMIGRKQQARFSSAVAVSILAYLTDYHVVPRRFTPGFELVFPRTLFPWLYAALAGSLIAGARMRQRMN
jgi:hypothetical protein